MAELRTCPEGLNGCWWVVTGDSQARAGHGCICLAGHSSEEEKRRAGLLVAEPALSPQRHTEEQGA